MIFPPSVMLVVMRIVQSCQALVIRWLSCVSVFKRHATAVEEEQDSEQEEEEEEELEVEEEEEEEQEQEQEEEQEQGTYLNGVAHRPARLERADPNTLVQVHEDVFACGMLRCQTSRGRRQGRQWCLTFQTGRKQREFGSGIMTSAP